MPGQFQLRARFTSPLVTIRDVRCRPHHRDTSDEEHVRVPTLVIARAGMFLKQLGSQAIVADANHVLLENPGDAYRVRHPVEGGDDCTVLEFTPRVLLEIATAADLTRPEREDWRFPVSHTLLDESDCRGLYHLVRTLRSRTAEPLAFEEQALDLLAHTLKRLGPPNRPHHRSRAATTTFHQDQCSRVQVLLNERLGEHLSLNDLASCAHASVFHLSRVFRAQTGLPIHRYLRRLRLRTALERLAEDTPDLTRLALELGFSSHSHFTEVFRQTFHTPPSAVRRQWSPQKLREVSKNLKV